MFVNHKVISAAAVGAVGGYLVSNKIYRRVLTKIAEKSLLAMSTAVEIVDDCGNLLNKAFNEGLSSEEASIVGEKIQSDIAFFHMMINEDL